MPRRTPDLQLLAVAEMLEPPWILFEDGAGAGTRMLVWDAAEWLRVEWSAGAAGSLAAFDPPGAWFGAIGYDLGLPPRAPRRAPLIAQPMADLFRPRQRIVLRPEAAPSFTGPDAQRYWNAAAGAAEAAGPGRPLAGAPAGGTARAQRSFDQPGFEAAVRRALEYIRAGDIYQVNLSVAERVPLGESAWQVYRRLREINPSPWMGFADFGDWQLVCGSPELLVEVQGGRARARPIAGTRRKTGDAAHDEAMRRELRSDRKEAAEHVMLVDLARNDLGRVARFGTVRVTAAARIEEYSHVMHLVSDVEGELAGAAPLALLRAMFPGGTITGAPKIRAMEIIAELEPVARGMYTGALGWWEGDAGQWNILIRSAVVRDGAALIQAGAGIVADSIPAREWKESLRKTAALRVALGLAPES